MTARTRARGKTVRRTPARDAATPRWTALALFLAAVFAVKLVVVFQLRGHPLLQPDAGLDTSTYVQLARRVLAGDLALGPGLYYMSPLYVYFLAGALALFESFTFVRGLQAALGTAAVGWIFISAHLWFGGRAAWMAASLAALTGVFTFYEVLILQSALDTFLTAAALACFAMALRGTPAPDREAWPASRWALAAGAVFGLQVLNRPNVLVAVAGLVVVLLAVRRWRMALLLCAGVLAALAPVVIRNVAVAHELALVSSQGGLNFYIGNNARATGQYSAVPGVRASVEGQSEDTRRVAEQATGRAMTDAAVSRYFSGLAWTWIREHPAAAARLFARKLALVFNAQHQWLDFSYPYYAYDVGSLLRVLVVGPWLLVPLGVTGLVFAAPPARRIEYAAWSAFVPFYALGVAVFFVAERYRLPVFVPLCVGAGAALDRAADAVRDRRFRPLAVAALCLLLAFVASNWRFHLDDGRFDERLRLAKVLMNRGQYGDAAAELATAHAIDPANTTAEFTLGMALVSDQRPAEGIPHIRHAVDAGVPIAGARYALARAMQASGDAVGAATLLRTLRPAPDDGADSCYQVGLLALDVKAPDVAERYFRQAVSQRPSFGGARQQLGLLLLGQGRWQDAAVELRSATENGIRDPGTLANLAYCEARLGRMPEARRLAQTILQIDPHFDLGPLLPLLRSGG